MMSRGGLFVHEKSREEKVAALMTLLSCWLSSSLMKGSRNESSAAASAQLVAAAAARNVRTQKLSTFDIVPVAAKGSQHLQNGIRLAAGKPESGEITASGGIFPVAAAAAAAADVKWLLVT